MTSHRDPRSARRAAMKAGRKAGATPGRRRTSGRARAVLTLGAVGALALGLGAQGTFAFWTDSGTVTTGSLDSGTLDITLNGALAGAANNGGSTTLSALTLSNMVPGESIAVAFPVANAGTAALTYTVAGSATGLLAPSMQYSLYPGTASNTGTAAANNRAGACTGTAIVTSQVLTGSSAPVIATPRSLAAAASESICVIAKLDTAADNTTQSKTTTASLVFNAKQVGAP